MIAACASNRGGSANPAPETRSEPAAGPGVSATAKFDGCDTCHVDVADEVVGTRHQAKSVTCAKCHGKSIGHVRDENNEVKPDRVFTPKTIDAFCGTCHKCDRPDAAKPPVKQGPTCTHCHGSHKIVRHGKPKRS